MNIIMFKSFLVNIKKTVKQNGCFCPRDSIYYQEKDPAHVLLGAVFFFCINLYDTIIMIKNQRDYYNNKNHLYDTIKDPAHLSLGAVNFLCHSNLNYEMNISISS